MDWKLMAGSHGVRRRRNLPDSDKVSFYWKPFEWHPTLESLVFDIYEKTLQPVVVYGEIYGSGVQDLAYGYQNRNMGYRIFDIKVGDQYLCHGAITEFSEVYGIPMVPVLYKGPFSWAKMEELAEGSTTLINDGSQIREGIVIRPMTEEVLVTGRKIRKLIGFGYLNRKGGTENH